MEDETIRKINEILVKKSNEKIQNTMNFTNVHELIKEIYSNN